MAAKEKQIKETKAKDEVAEYLIRAGVEPGKANSRPDAIPSMKLRRESPFAWSGADHRPDLLRYSMVFNDKQQRQLERKGFFLLDSKAVDVRMVGIADGRVMARPLDLDKKANQERAQYDWQRRNAKNVRTGGLNEETGASLTTTSNYSPATATEA